LVVAAAAVVSACLGGRPAQVSPEEIPQLEQRLAEEPGNARLLLRYAAALFAADDCDSAKVVALRGMAARPQDAVGPLVLGQCYEGEAEWDQALSVYRQFLASHADRPGAPAVRAREGFALRNRAAQRAQQALAREAELAAQPADPQTLAVLPIDIAGDSMYQPLSRGLAQMLTSDLALLQRFRMVERLQVSALLSEMELVETGAVDQSTAARMGRLLQAGRMVQGLAAIPEEGDVRFEASVVRSDGRVTTPEIQTGRLRDLLRLEKQVVVGIANQLGYQLSEAERQQVLENGTQNLAAFLAYSRGLVAEDLGDYVAAAQHFSEAVQQDPDFSQARESFEANAVAEQVRDASAAEVTTVAQEEVTPEAAGTGDATETAVTSTVYDVASTDGESQTQTSAGDDTRGTEQTTQHETSSGNPTGQQTTQTTSQTVTGTIKIFFRIP
jgi:tetratricopeptide (TPR) repeat protein